jgi:hypothetical protein
MDAEESKGCATLMSYRMRPDQLKLPDCDAPFEWPDWIELICGECKKPFLSQSYIAGVIAMHNGDEAEARASLKVAIAHALCEDCEVWKAALDRRRQERRR